MRIAVLGAGSMGRWFAGILSGKHDLRILDIIPEKAGGIDGVRALKSMEQLREFRPELLLNAVSIQETVPVFRAAEPFIEPECLLADVTSVKGNLPGYYRVCGLRFVSLHPMFGPTFANVENLKHENVIMITDSDPRGMAFFRGVFRNQGLNIFECGFEDHDRMIAYSLTLPFASSMIFSACLDPEAVPGTTFRKHREIAKGLLSEDDHLLAEILLNPHSLEQLDRVTARLEFLKHVIRARDQEELRRFFKDLRRNLGFPE